LLLAIAFWGYKSLGSGNESISFETAKVEKGAISNTISATGTLEAIKTVEVGTQVSGVIEKIFVDFNSQVKKGQLLAQLDQASLLITLEQSKASVDEAQAQVNYQKSTYERYKALINKQLIAQSDYDLVEYNYKMAVAGLNSAQSTYTKSKINLSYARIYSPIDGIILERDVDEGQTVAASYSTPTLFTIANDLTQMQVEASVDEADIGLVKNNQRVEFTVDAFPLKKFSGKVTEIRLQPVESSNVITYTVIINAPNPEKILMPGMTATANFFVTEAKDILLVPAKAIRFTPDPVVMAQYNASVQGEEEVAERPQRPPMEEKAGEDQELDKEGFMVWVKEGNKFHPQEVTLGVTDEIHYELLSGLTEGQEVIVSMKVASKASAGSAAAASKSPFMPQRPGRNK
jgi:HlyD family secretion protein